VKLSPWRHGKGDVLKEFVASCKKYGVKICYYFAANANCYEDRPTPEIFLKIQLEQLTELLTQYGPVNRFMWYLYGRPCTGLSHCPGGFPEYWTNITLHVRKLSPKTLMWMGADGCEGGDESGFALYPNWYGSDVDCASGTVCDGNCGSGDPFGPYYRPCEADYTIQNPGDWWFWHPHLPYYTAKDMWMHYVMTVGRGYNSILNLPPNTTGIIPYEYAQETRKFGSMLKETFAAPIAQTTASPWPCGIPVVLPLDSVYSFDVILLMEDLQYRQSVAMFAIDVQLDSKPGTWQQISVPANQTIGHKIINWMTTPVERVVAVRFRALKCLFPSFCLKQFAIYDAIF